MTVTLASPHNDVWLSIRGSQNGAVLTSILSETAQWSGSLPATQDYLISAVAAGGDTKYLLQIQMASVARPTPAPAPTATPAAAGGSAAKGVIYLTFDDGPVDPRWTPQVLAELARLDAKVTFFVLGQLAARYPDLVAAEVKAGTLRGEPHLRAPNTGQDRPGGVSEGGPEHRGNTGGPRHQVPAPSLRSNRRLHPSLRG